MGAQGVRRAARVLAALVVLAATLVAAPATSAAQRGGFDVVFRVNIDAAHVEVELSVPLGRQRPVELYVHDVATQVEATVDGVAASVSLGEPDGLERPVTINAPDSGEELQLRYVIPSAEPRSDGYTRVNPAYAAFLALVDANLGGGSVRVELPPGFFGALDRRAFDLESRGADGEVWTGRMSASDFFEIVARNEDGLARSTVNVEGREITVAGWDDDPEWIDFTENTIRWGVPLMADLIGQRWPEGDLVVLESTVPAEFGYGGWFSVWLSEIEVGDQLDETLMLHELAHAWFHNERIEDRWITEGWAEDYSALALSLQTGEPVTPPLPDLSAAGTTELARWGVPTVDDFESVFNRYDTSWFVLHTIREEIGVDATADVLAAIFEGRRAYHRDGDPAVFPSTGTARLLDLFEEVGGSTIAEDLFRTYVFPSSSDAALAQRAEARAAYGELVAISDLSPPLAIRDRLSRWRFQEAQLLIDEALPVAARLAALEERADRLGAGLPVRFVDGYETGSMTMSELSGAIDLAERSLVDIEAMAPGERARALQRFTSGTLSSAAPAATPAEDSTLFTPTVLAGAAGVAVLFFTGFVAMAFRVARRQSADLW